MKREQKQQQNTRLTITIPRWFNIYTIASVFPTISVFSCWIVYYSMKHHTPGIIRTISETVVPFPENRIFPVTMNMECIFLAIAFWLRNSVTEQSSKQQNKSVAKRLFFMKLVIPFILYGLSILSVLTLEDHFIFHITGAMIFFGLMIVYLLLADSTARTLDWKVNKGSRIVSYLIPGVFFGHYIVFSIFRSRNANLAISVGSLMQYIMCVLIFSKVFLLQFDLPEYSFTKSEHVHDE